MAKRKSASTGPKLTKLFIVYVQDDDLGECQGMFDAKGKLLGAWTDNDGNWRNEYFSPFMEELGFEVDDREQTDKDIKQLKEFFGF